MSNLKSNKDRDRFRRMTLDENELKDVKLKLDLKVTIQENNDNLMRVSSHQDFFGDSPDNNNRLKAIAALSETNPITPYPQKNDPRARNVSFNLGGGRARSNSLIS